VHESCVSTKEAPEMAVKLRVAVRDEASAPRLTTTVLCVTPVVPWDGVMGVNAARRRRATAPVVGCTMVERM
jgi:hypothetical protein